MKMAVAAGLAGVTLLIFPTSSKAAGFLDGTFWVACPKCGHVDKVEDITRNHKCENDKCKNDKDVDGGTCYVTCPDGHWKDNKVEGVTRQHQCQKKVGGGICGKQCRGPFAKPTPEPKD
jgi:hypothetical protein